MATSTRFAVVYRPPRNIVLSLLWLRNAQMAFWSAGSESASGMGTMKCISLSPTTVVIIPLRMLVWVMPLAHVRWILSRFSSSIFARFCS